MNAREPPNLEQNLSDFSGHSCAGSIDSPALTRPLPLPLTHRLWQRLPAGPRRGLLTRLLPLLAPRPVTPPPPAPGGVIVAGEFSRASGLGEGARLMLRALVARGIPAWPLDLGTLLPAHTPDLPPPPPAAPPPDAALVLHVNPPLLPLALTRLPRGLVRGRRIVGYWVWELPQAPPGWRHAARLVHDIWTPSRFSAAALAAFGTPLVVPHPLAEAPLLPAPLTRADFGLPEGAVVVLVSCNLASSFARKNPLAAVAAFRAAFGDRRDRLLVLKLGHPEHDPAGFASVRAAIGTAPNIRLETRVLPGPDVLALTACADLVLSLHRSEGMGLVPAEAMLLGRPVIATGWSGNLAFMDADSAALVRYRLVPVADPRAVYGGPRGGPRGGFSGGPSAVWAEADIADAARHLRRLADDAPARLALGAAGAAMARAMLSADPLVAAVRGLAG